MGSIRALRIVLALALGAALPTILSIWYYLFTGDPTFRPLGISKAALEHFDPPESPLDIVVAVGWGADARPRQTEDQLAGAIGRSLAVYDVAFRFRHFSIEGDQVLVWYIIRQTELGPYPAGQAAKGLSAAVTALRMNLKAEGHHDNG